MSAAAALVAAAGAVFAVSAIRLAVIDLRSRVLPTLIIWRTAAAVWVLYSAASLFESDGRGLIWSAVGATACGLPLAALSLVHPASMGLGDARLAGLCGLVCGWWGLNVAVIGLTLGFCAALPEATYVLVRHGATASRPLGPYLAAGAFGAAGWAMVVYGAVPAR